MLDGDSAGAAAAVQLNRCGIVEIPSLGYADGPQLGTQSA